MNQLYDEDESVLRQNMQQMSAQLEIAVRALHVIALMTDISSDQASEMSLDTLREMEIEGMLYDFCDDYED